MAQKTDWSAIKAEYLSGSASLRDLAAKYGASFSSMGKLASKEGWEALRRQAATEKETAAITQAFDDSTRLLAEFNRSDYAAAVALKKKATQMLQGTIEGPAQLRAIASVFETAQRIGRLALGAETERVVSSVRQLEPLSDEDFLG